MYLDVKICKICTRIHLPHTNTVKIFVNVTTQAKKNGLQLDISQSVSL